MRNAVVCNDEHEKAVADYEIRQGVSAADYLAYRYTGVGGQPTNNPAETVATNPNATRLTIASRAKGGLLPGKLTILGPDGKAQMELSGGNHIFSQADTRELVSRSLKARTPAELRELGGRIKQMLDKQDGNKPEYVQEQP